MQGNRMPNELFIPDYIEVKSPGVLNPDYTICISGAKNEVLGAMAAAVLTDQAVILDNVPHISDVLDMGKIMQDLGIIVEYSPETRRMFLHAKEIKSNTLSDEAYKFRASYYLWGAILARFAITKEFDSLNIKIPGGCSFGGKRPIDYHTELLQNIFDAEVSEKDDKIEIKLPKVRAAHDDNPIYSTVQVSHGATFHWMLSAATSDRPKFIYNASLEPEVGHLLGILNGMGARLRGTNHTAISSFGHGELLRGGTYSILPDRLETASYALLALALRDEITIEGVDSESCMPWMNSVKEVAGFKRIQTLGKDFVTGTEKIRFSFRDLELPARTFQMSPFPGKETDLQQIWAPVLASARSGATSILIDPIWSNRFGHLAEMEKFGLKSEHRQIDIKNSVAPKALWVSIHSSHLHSADVCGMDLRGTFGLIICACMAKGGASQIEKPGFALRGYPDLVKNLRRIGVGITESESGKILPTLPSLQR